MTHRRQEESDYQSVLEQLRQQARQLEISAQVSRQLTAALDLDELLLQVVELIKSSFDYYHVHVYLIDPESRTLIMREGTGEAGKTLRARGHRIPFGMGMVGAVGESGRPLLASDVAQQPNWLANPVLPETRSELAVPLTIGDRVLGVLDVQSDQVGGLTEVDLALMESLGQQIAVAVQNALLFRAVQAVNIVSRAVGSGLGMEEVLAGASRELKTLVDFDYMTIAYYDEQTGQAELIGVDDQTGVDIPLEEGVRLPAELCIPGMAIREGRTIIVPDLAAPPFGGFIDAEILDRNGMSAVMSVPLRAQGRSIAAVNLVSSRERAFTTADAQLMEQVSGPLSAAVENARVFERVQRMVEERSSESTVFRAMVENASEAVALANAQQLLTYANPAFYALHGYDPSTDDLMRRPLTSFIVSEDEAALSDDIDDHMRGGRVWQEEVRHRRKGNQSFQAATTIFAVGQMGGEPAAIAALIRDVTAERKLMTASQAASSTPELDRLAPLVLECIAADTDIDRAILILYDRVGQEGPETMSIVATYEPQTGGQQVADQHMRAEDSPFSTVVYYERRAVWVADVATDERLFEQGRALLREHGIVSMLALPIMVRDNVVGMVAIDWRDHVELTYDQIQFYQLMVNQVSSAVENARLVARQQRELMDTIRRLGREVATVTELAQEVSAVPGLEETFRRVVNLLQDRFGYYHVRVYHLDADGQELVLAETAGAGAAAPEENGLRLTLDGEVVGRAVRTGQPVLVRRVGEGQSSGSESALPETRSQLVVPIKLGEVVVGVLDVQDDEPDTLSEEDQFLMVGLCGQIAIAIRNAQLLDEVTRSQQAAQRRAQQLELSAGVSERLTANLDLNTLLAAVVNLIQQGFNYYHVHVYLVEPDGSLAMMEGTGPAGQEMKARGHRLAAGKGLVGRAARSGRPVLAADVRQEPGWLPNALLPETKSELSVPFKLGETVVGVLDVQSDRTAGLSQEDQALLEGLAGQIAVAVQNARLFGDIERQVGERTREVQIFQALTENASDAVAMADLEGQLFYANAAWYELYGRDVERQEAVGMPAEEIWSAEAMEWMHQALARSQSRGWRGEMSRSRPDGSHMRLELTLFVVRDEQGEPIAVAAMGRDITSSRLSSELTCMVSAASSLGELGTDLLRLLIWGMHVQGGVFVLFEGKEGTAPRVARTVAEYDERRQMVVGAGHSEPFDSDPLYAQVYQAETAVIYNDLQVLPAERRASLEASGVQAVAAVPLLDENEGVSGALILYRHCPDPFDDEIAFLVPLLQQVSLAVSNLVFRESRERETAQMLEQRAAEVRTTTEVAQAIASALQLDELFQRLVTLIKERFGYYHVHVYQLDAENGELELAAGYGEPGRIMKQRGHRIPIGKGLVGTAARSGEPVLATDVSEWANWLPNPLLPDTRSELAVPIKMGEEVLGILDVQDDRIGGIDQDAEVLLLGLCGQIAIAIQNTRLLQEMQASLRRTDLLLRLSTVLSSLTDPEAIADALTEQLMSIVSIDRCSIALFRDHDLSDMPRAAEVYSVRDRDVHAGEGTGNRTCSLAACPLLLEEVVQKHQLLAVSDVLGDERLADAERTLLHQGDARSAVVVPMISGERVIGCLILQNRQLYSFSDAELELYRGIGNQSATAWSNALSLQEVQETLDGVNMLYETSRAVSTADTADALTDTIIQRIVSTNVDHCEILLYQRENSGAASVEVVGSWSALGDAPQPGTRLRLRDYALAGPARELKEKGTRVFAAGDADQPDPVRQFCAARGIKALALVSLHVGAEKLGFLLIERRKLGSFSSDVLRFYETIASQSAVALRNLQLIEQTQEQLDQLKRSYDDMAHLAATVRELSSPVIQVWEDVLVLPLVGAIDSRRAMNMMESLLSGITEYQAEQVIIDITGVPVMDTSVANYLLQTVKAASLLGARCMLVGISPEMAQTIVGLGLNLSSIRTYSNLRAGIQAALESIGFAITPLAGGEENA